MIRLCCGRAHLPNAYGGYGQPRERKGARTRPYLVVESSLLLQEFEILHVCLASPEVHVGYFKVAPNYLTW